ncbi:VOC family protein [Micromonospora zamorensis]|uniref:VOC family protein n=1 Tax=Micromonospora zamorensis TaxID=709883 RepID=UPI002E2B7118|nr:VOC family protein [Micromonospora zamorensis]
MFRTPQMILFSEDVLRAAEFYAGLGFTETFRVPVEGEPIHIDLVLDGYKIGIASVASTRDDHGLDPVPQGQRAAVILWTDDTAAAYAALTASGAPRTGCTAPVARSPADRLDGRPGRQPDSDRPAALSWAAPNRDPSADDERSLPWWEGPCAGRRHLCGRPQRGMCVQPCW